MEVSFDDGRLSRLESGEDRGTDLEDGVLAKFLQRMKLIRAAPDERDFYAFKSLHFEKLHGDRKHQRSMRLTRKWRLVIEIRGEGKTKKVHVISIEDYH